MPWGMPSWGMPWGMPWNMPQCRFGGMPHWGSQMRGDWGNRQGPMESFGGPGCWWGRSSEEERGPERRCERRRERE